MRVPQQTLPQQSGIHSGANLGTDDPEWIKMEPEDSTMLSDNPDPSWRFLASPENSLSTPVSWSDPPPLTFCGNEDGIQNSKKSTPPYSVAPLRQAPPLHHASDMIMMVKVRANKFMRLESVSPQQVPHQHCVSDALQTDEKKKAASPVTWASQAPAPESISSEFSREVAVRLESPPKLSSRDLQTVDILPVSSHDGHTHLSLEGIFPEDPTSAALTTHSLMERSLSNSSPSAQTVNNVIETSLQQQAPAVCEMMETVHNDSLASLWNAAKDGTDIKSSAESSDLEESNSPTHIDHQFLQKPAVQGKRMVQQQPSSLSSAANKTVKKQGTKNGAKSAKGHTPTQRPRPHACPECGLAFYGRHSLQKHMAMSKHTATLTCKFCEYPFKDQESLDQHVIQQHKCLHCDRLFQFATQRTSHMKTHSAAKDTVCEICGILLATSSSLTAHRQQVHSEQRSHRCEVCGATFKIAQGLQRHLKLSHTDKRSFECEHCGGKFKTPYTLKKHTMIHTVEDKTYTCPCGAAFKSKGGLHQHNSHVHRALTKAHSCPHCDRSFLSLQHLSMHRKGAHKDETI